MARIAEGLQVKSSPETCIQWSIVAAAAAEEDGVEVHAVYWKERVASK